MITQAGEAEARIGLLGELEVELRLAREGWHPVRLDTAQMAANADLLAVRGKHRPSIQVKTTNAEKQHSHRSYLGFGYSTGYLRDGRPIFNSKASPLVADVVVGVAYRINASRFVIMPVAFAEALCRLHCEYWHGVPTKTSSTVRSHSFPIYLNFSGEGRTHQDHNQRVRRNLAAFEDAWHVLLEPLEKLHDRSAWTLLS